jgi:hypothetical protein
MPRGGRRPGAGAPRGNLNAFRSGNRSRRMREVALGLRVLEERGDTPALHEILIAIRDAGLLGPRGSRFDMRQVVPLIHPMIIDRLRATVNPNNQSRPRSGAPAAAPPPSVESGPPSSPPPAPTAQENREQTTDNQSR